MRICFKKKKCFGHFLRTAMRNQEILIFLNIYTRWLNIACLNRLTCRRIFKMRARRNVDFRDVGRKLESFTAFFNKVADGNFLWKLREGSAFGPATTV